MRPSEVIEAVADFQRRCTDPTFERVLRGSLAQSFKSTVADQRAEQFYNRLKVALPTAHGHYQVTTNMVRLVQVALECFTEEDTFRRDFAPSLRGFVQFEVPIQLLDIRGELLHVSWLYWDLEMDVCVVWSDTRWPDSGQQSLKDYLAEAVPGQKAEDTWNRVIQVTGHRWCYSGTGWLEDGERLVRATAETRKKIADYYAEQESHTGFQESSHNIEKLLDAGIITQTDLHDSQIARLLKALWVLMAQRTGEITVQPLDRAAAKRAKRLNLPTEVTVIELRAPQHYRDPEAPEGSGRAWGHRWMVRGHFAWRACGEHHPLAEPYEKGWRCRIWINPYAKLADREDLDWKVGEKVWVLKR